MKNRISLAQFKVQSFVTNVDYQTAEEVKAGALPASHKGCGDKLGLPSEAVLCTRHGGGCNTADDCNSEGHYCPYPDYRPREY